MFPTPAPWTDRGAIGDFGAPRNGGRTHEGFDIVAKCGAKLVAVHDGTVIRRGFDPVLYGNYLLIKGAAESQNYFYAHLIRPAEVKIGQQVATGQFVGNEGKTGNAETIGCHLHFEIRSGGRPIDPEPLLNKWEKQAGPGTRSGSPTRTAGSFGVSLLVVAEPMPDPLGSPRWRPA